MRGKDDTRNEQDHEKEVEKAETAGGEVRPGIQTEDEPREENDGGKAETDEEEARTESATEEELRKDRTRIDDPDLVVTAFSEESAEEPEENGAEKAKLPNEDDTAADSPSHTHSNELDFMERSALELPAQDGVPRKSALKRTPSKTASAELPGLQRSQSTRFDRSVSGGNYSDGERSSSRSPSRLASAADGDRGDTALSRGESSFSGASSFDAAKKVEFNHARFEKKKRRIAARLRTQQEIDKFRKETGATLGGQWVDQKWVARSLLLEQEDEKDKFHAKQWLKEVGLYVLFVFAFTWVLYSGRSNVAFIGYKQFWTATVDKHISQVTTPDSVLESIEALFLEDLVERDNFTKDSYATAAARGYLHGSVLIGEVRLRQLRVKEGECSRTHQRLADFGIAPSRSCYPAWVGGEEEDVYSKENGTVLAAWDAYPFYSYTSAAGAAEKGFQGKFGSYHGGGFSANFSAPTARATLAAMREMHWVDVKTRAVMLNFVFFNVDLDLFASYRGVFELVGSGVVVTSSDVEVISLIRYPVVGLLDVVRVGMLGLVYLMVVYYVFEELDHCRKHGLNKYRSFGWAYVDAINICLFVLSGMFKVTNLVLFELAMPANISDLGMTQRVEELGYSLYLEDQINGLNGLLLWMKMLRYVPITRRLQRLSTVLAASLPDICNYAFLFAVLLYAFAVLGFLLFGNHLAGFLTVTNACLSLLRAMYGDVDFEELIEAVGDTGFGFVFAWLILSNVVLLNIVIAILSQDYRRVQQEEAENPTPSVHDKLKAEVMAVYKEVRRLQKQRAGQEPASAASVTKGEGQLLSVWVRDRVSRLFGGAPPARVAEEPKEEGDSSDEDGDSVGSVERGESLLYDAQDAPMQVGGQWKPFPARATPAP